MKQPPEQSPCCQRGRRRPPRRRREPHASRGRSSSISSNGNWIAVAAILLVRASNGSNRSGLVDAASQGTGVGNTRLIVPPPPPRRPSSEQHERQDREGRTSASRESLPAIATTTKATTEIRAGPPKIPPPPPRRPPHLADGIQGTVSNEEEAATPSKVNREPTSHSNTETGVKAPVDHGASIREGTTAGGVIPPPPPRRRGPEVSGDSIQQNWRHRSADASGVLPPRPPLKVLDVGEESQPGTDQAQSDTEPIESDRKSSPGLVPGSKSLVQPVVQKQPEENGQHKQQDSTSFPPPPPRASLQQPEYVEPVGSRGDESTPDRDSYQGSVDDEDEAAAPLMPPHQRTIVPPCPPLVPHEKPRATDAGPQPEGRIDDSTQNLESEDGEEVDQQLASEQSETSAVEGNRPTNITEHPNSRDSTGQEHGAAETLSSSFLSLDQRRQQLLQEDMLVKEETATREDRRDAFQPGKKTDDALNLEEHLYRAQIPVSSLPSATSSVELQRLTTVQPSSEVEKYVSVDSSMGSTTGVIEQQNLQQSSEVGNAMWASPPAIQSPSIVPPPPPRKQQPQKHDQHQKRQLHLQKPPQQQQKQQEQQQQSGRMPGPSTRLSSGQPFVQQWQPSAQRYGQHSRFAARPVRSNGQVPAWKRVWNKIEHGLDGLADLEDTVTGRAHELLEKTRSTVRIPIRKVADATSYKRRKARPQPKQSEPVEATFDLSRFEKKSIRANTKTETPSSSETPVSTKVATPNLYGEIYKRSLASAPKKPSSVAIRKVDWNSAATGKVIRANGGASVPSPGSQRQEASGTESSEGASRDTSSFEQRRQIPPAGYGINNGERVPSPRDTQQQPRAASRELQAGRDRAPVATSDDRSRPRQPMLDKDEENSFSARLARILPTIPRFPRIRLNPFGGGREYGEYSSATLDAWKADDEQSTGHRGFFGLFQGRRTESENADRRLPSRRVKENQDDSSLTPTMVDLIDRCNDGKSASLLTASDAKAFRGFGRTRAVLDIVKLMSLLVIAKQVMCVYVAAPRDMPAVAGSFTPLLSLAAGIWDSWAPIAIASALLASCTDSFLCMAKLESLLQSLEESVRDETRYGSLFLRVVSSISTPRDTAEVTQASAKKQAMAKVESARLRFFASSLLVALAAVTISIGKSVFVSSIQAIIQIVSLEQWRTWPPQWVPLATGIQEVVRPLVDSLVRLASAEVSKIAENPMKIAFEGSLFAAIVIVSLLPGLENRRKVQPSISSGDAEEEDAEAVEAHTRFTEQISDIGSSSASRLDFLLCGGRAIEIMLERWKVTIPRIPAVASGFSPTLFRIIGYNLLSGVLLALPLIVCAYAHILPFSNTMISEARWEVFFDAFVVLSFTHHLVGQALCAAVQSKEAQRHVSNFLSTLAGVADERKKTLQSRGMDLQLQASLSPTAGIEVKDLWAAHTTKRAWAVRGASISCRNGEIVILLGDAGSGKSRLLTTLAEAAASPPRSACSSTIVRGTVSFAGIDTGRWDKPQLNRRLGLLLNDVRTVADSAKVLSGLSLEELLEPSSEMRVLDPAHVPSSSERSSMILALKIAGLYSTLLPRLPSKLSTVVTATEEDLRPSTLRPRYSILSPVEWSKLLLARVLAQAIHDNDNSLASSEHVEQCLVGSFLLLDDVTAYFSEVDEARLLQDLRRTGAATVMSSSRWATGRFADRIAVLKDGAIVESGTHSELLNRGPQQSIYAAKWHAMTTQ